MFEKRGQTPQQEQLWIEAKTLPPATASRFYERVNATLEKIGFAQEVWKICEPAYAQAPRGGRPGIDPVVYLKMLMVGFFEDLPSERAIASRGADSFSIRGFLGYELTQPTPDHPSLSVIRYRLSAEQFDAIHLILLRALRAHDSCAGDSWASIRASSKPMLPCVPWSTATPSRATGTTCAGWRQPPGSTRTTT